MTAGDTRKKVLIVEDQIALREAVATEFENFEWDTILAEDGNDALEKWRADTAIDLIVSDIRMPKCDGPQFLDSLRAVSAQTPPFIFMTGFSDLKTYEAYDRGADAIIGKPLNPYTLAEVITAAMTPLNMKWSKHILDRSEIKLVCKIPTNDNHSLQFGRLGFFVASQTFSLPNSLPIRTTIDFEIDCAVIPSGSLKGSGKVVWSRHNDTDGLVNGYGVQLNYLEERCRIEYIQMVKDFKHCSAIPSGRIGGGK